MFARCNFRSLFANIGAIVGVAVAVVVFMSTDALAQSANWAYPSHILSEGELRNVYHMGGSKCHCMGCEGLEWPAWNRFRCHYTGGGLWLATKNFDDGSQTWEHKISHLGYRTTRPPEFFPTDVQKTLSDKPRPRVFVDGLDSFLDPIKYDEIDPNLESPGKVITEVASESGLSMTRTVWAFSNDYHDDYHIIEYTIKNTGDTDGDGEADVPEQTLEDVYFLKHRNWEISQETSAIVGNGAGWGRNMMHDVSFGKGLEEHNEDLRAQWSWLGFEPQFTRWNSIGGPVITDEASTIFPGDSLGRLSSGHMPGFVTLHADETGHAPGETVEDDPDQPSLTGYISNGSPLNVNNHLDTGQMAQEYALLEDHEWDLGAPGSHADDIVGEPESEPETKQEWRRRMANQTADPGVDIEGFIAITAYGPYDLEPGEQFTVVRADGIAGLSKEAKLEIGREFKRLRQQGRPNDPIAYDADGDGMIESDERMSKNMWVMTSRDSLFQLFRRAKANWESDFGLRKAPKPPNEFRVRGGPDQVQLEWTTYGGANPPAGFEVYRGSIRREGDPNRAHYKKIAGIDELGPSARSYTDTTPQRGIPYHYYVQAVGEELTQEGPAGTPAGVRLRSNRIYTQTWNGVTLKRPPGESIAEARVVPNPYTLTSDKNVRWQGQQDRIGFLDIPGECTIRIYTETGELVTTIHHTDGSGDDFWDLTTTSNQLVVSGVYGAVITTPDGRQATRKFTIIR